MLEVHLFFQGFLPYPRDTFAAGLDICKRRGLIRPNAVFLDLGAGKAGIVREAARFNLDAYGIEFHENLAEIADNEIRIARRSGEISTRAVCSVVSGNYYPHDYLTLRANNFAVALQYEDIFFSYAWGIELPSQLEIFSRYAASDALFLNETAAEPEKHEELLTRLGLEQEILEVWSPQNKSKLQTTSGLMLYRKTYDSQSIRLN